MEDRARPDRLRAFLLVGLVAGMLVVFVGAWLAHPRPFQDHTAVPDQHRQEEYVGSGACRACHPSEYETWKASYHRSMTRRPRELDWNGRDAPLLPHDLSLFGRDFRLVSEQSRIFVTGPDLHQVAESLRRGAAHALDPPQFARRAYAEASLARREVVLVTGSHHYLAFWVEGGDDQELRQLPFVYLLSEKHWAPRDEAFLQPPDALPHLARWNANCIQCHSVAGRPGQSEGHDESGRFWERYETDAAELGIACEACHGPGGRHSARFRDPIRRFTAQTRPPPDALGATRQRMDIFVPGYDDANLGSEACGQCHSYFIPKDPEEWWDVGFSRNYRPGIALAASRDVLAPQTDPTRNALDPPSLPLSIKQDSLFWADGAIMVGGREYNALKASACNQHGQGETKLACTHCHQLHGSDPDHQLARRFTPTAENPSAPDGMCLSCHLHVDQAHSRHPTPSAGARCVNCHMPKTSYALLQGVASHWITSPQHLPRDDSMTGQPPHACALCHIDRTRTWINQRLREFSVGAIGPSAAPTEPDAIPWAVRRALSGNAAERALFADALGRLETSDPSQRAWARLTLQQLENDPYQAVVRIARRGLSHYGQDFNVPADFPPVREQLVLLHQERDNTPITISE